MRRKAFTLIEMLVVIALVAFVASVIAPKGFGMIKSIDNFLEQKKAGLEIDRLRMIAYSTDKSALIGNKMVHWDDNTSLPFPYDFQGTITSKGLLVLP